MLAQAGAQALQGVMGIATSLIGGRARRQEMEEAQQGFDKARRRMENLDTSNLYANMENPYEDLTVNTQQADFLAQQQQAGLAGMMGVMQGAAGGSGIAALAQAMANQQSQNQQQASASIGQQEARNQAMAAQGAAQVQSMERQGAAQARNLEMGKSRFIFDQSGMRLGAAQQAQQAATDQLMAGVGGVMTGGVMGWQESGDGTSFGQAMSDRRLKKNIKLIGYSPNKLKIYAFEYINEMFGKGIFQGVMSDEIPQHAVINNNGYDMVDYSKLDVEFKRIK